jgi:hypothetical protein
MWPARAARSCYKSRLLLSFTNRSNSKRLTRQLFPIFFENGAHRNQQRQHRRIVLQLVPRFTRRHGFNLFER